MDLTAIVGFVVLVILVILIKSIGSSSARKTQELPYEPKGSLLTRAERSFFGVLEQAVGSNFRIFAKVRVADVLTPKKGRARGERQSAVN